ncbi:MAG: GNAT family N-acetyltransferase, partial [Mesorhizobium sp.]
LQPGFETARMYKGKAPQLTQPGVFAMTTLELG